MRPSENKTYHPEDGDVQQIEYEELVFTYHGTRYGVEIPEHAVWPLCMTLSDTNEVIQQHDRNHGWILVNRDEVEPGSYQHTTDDVNHIYYALPLPLAALPQRIEAVRVAMHILEMDVDSMDHLRDTGMKFATLEPAIRAQKLLWHELNIYLRDSNVTQMTLPKGW